MPEQIQENERVAIFIDNNFLYLGLKATIPEEYRKVDYLRLCRKMAHPGRLTRIRLYVSPPPPFVDTSGYERWRRKMEALPFVDIVEGKIKKRVRVVRLAGSRKLEKAEYYEQKGVDVKLAIDMIALARIQAFDVAILVSGDSDFVGLAELVKQFNLHILNAHCPASREHSYYYSKELERICDRPPIILDRHFLSDCVSS